MRKVLLLISVLLLAGCNTSDDKVEIKLNDGFDIVTVGQIHTDTGCTITIGSDMFDMEVIGTDVDTSTLGEYLITYSYTDLDDESYSCLRYVKVVDDISPTATLNEGIDTIKVGEEFIDAGIEYSDNFDLDLEVIVKGEVDTSVAGRYIITYKVIDDSFNSVEIVRVVNVIN